MSGTWKIGIVGLGVMGRQMLAQLLRHPRYEVVAVWDPDAASCARAAALAPQTRIASSADEVIAASDLVYLACPPVPRTAYALAAAEAGRGVFLEKPFCVDVEEGRNLAARLNASGVPAAVNFTQAASPALATVVADRDMGAPRGIDIVVTYAAWPRAWQVAADWLRFAAEGGYVREVISHFLFFSERVLGPLDLVWSRATWPADPALCETHVAARLETASGVPVSVFGSVGGAQPDRQELTVMGAARSWRVSDFYQLSVSDGGAFEPVAKPAGDPDDDRLTAQLDELDLAMRGAPHRLATVDEALRVQVLIETMLTRGGWERPAGA